MKLIQVLRTTHILWLLAATLTLALPMARTQTREIEWSAEEKPLVDQIHGLRGLADDVRGGATKALALKVRKLPPSENKLRLALGLATLSTEGDFGHETLQAVATTLADALREHPRPRPEAKAAPSKRDEAAARAAAYPYQELAALVRYEHVDATLDDEQFRAATAQLEADDHQREHLDFTLKDLSGKSWTFAELRGKVVLVNFWATWCPPCRKEMPDLQALYERFGAKGLVVLGISDETPAKVEPFIHGHNFSFPVLLDPGRKVTTMFAVEGIPKSFVYNREGKLVAQSIDMRTEKQFLEMLGKAGLQ